MTGPERNEEVFLSIGETARQLGVSVDTIRNWETTEPPKIHGTRTASGQRRFPLSEVERILSEMRDAS